MESTFQTKVQDALQRLMDNVNRDKNTDIKVDELEFRFGKKEQQFNPNHNIEKFQKILAYIREISNSNNETNEIMLDIKIENSNVVNLDDLRISVKGADDFNKFCKQNNLNDLDNTVYEKKNRISNISVDDYSFIRISASSEEIYILENSKVGNVSLTEINNVLKSSTIKKIYRLKKRYSFLFNDIIRVDMTEVRQGTGYNFKQARIKETSPMYEIEIEIISKIDPKNIDNLKNNEKILNFLEEFSSIYNNTKKEYLLSDNEKIIILKQYLACLNIKIDEKIIQKNPKKYFSGTDVRPLERTHIELENGKSALVRDNYTVSIKADGLRMLMFLIEQNNNVDYYGIDSSLNIIKMGNFKSKSKSENDPSSYYIVDGELVITRSLGTVFMCFDILYFKNIDIRQKEFYTTENNSECRSNYLTKFNSLFNFENQNIIKKIIPNKVLKNQNDIIEFINSNDKLDYETDGLIFTPKGKYPVDITDTSNIRLKWKPPNMQSIDFKLKIEKSNNKYKLISTQDGLKIEAELTYKSNKNYPTFVVKDRPDISKIRINANENGKPMFERKIIENGTIAECIFQDSQWKIMRLRPDKKEPNAGITVNSNWKLITDPITIAELTGTVRKDIKNLESNIKEPKIKFNKEKSESVIVKQTEKEKEKEKQTENEKEKEKEKETKNKRFSFKPKSTPASASASALVVEPVVAEKPVVKPVVEPVSEKPVPVDPSVPKQDYSKMTVIKLKELCKTRGITGYSGKRKADLIKLLTDNDNKVS